MRATSRTRTTARTIATLRQRSSVIGPVSCPRVDGWAGPAGMVPGPAADAPGRPVGGRSVPRSLGSPRPGRPAGGPASKPSPCSPPGAACDRRRAWAWRSTTAASTRRPGRRRVPLERDLERRVEHDRDGRPARRPGRSRRVAALARRVTFVASITVSHPRSSRRCAARWRSSKAAATGALVGRVVGDDRPKGIRRQDLGRAEVASRERRLAGAGHADQDDQAAGRNGDLGHPAIMHTRPTARRGRDSASLSRSWPRSPRISTRPTCPIDRRRPTGGRSSSIFWITSIVEGIGVSQIFAFVPLYLSEMGVAEPDRLRFVGIFSALIFIVGAPLVPLWGVWADKYSRKAVIARSALVEAIVFAGVALSSEPWQLALSMLLVGFQLGNTGVMLAAIRDVVPIRRLGTLIAVFGGQRPDRVRRRTDPRRAHRRRPRVAAVGDLLGLGGAVDRDGPARHVRLRARSVRRSCRKVASSTWRSERSGASWPTRSSGGSSRSSGSPSWPPR